MMTKKYLSEKKTSARSSLNRSAQPSAQKVNAGAVRYRAAQEVKVTGATSPFGAPWVQVGSSRKAVWVKLADFAGTDAAREKLKAGGIILFQDEWVRCRKRVEALRDFPPRPLIDRPGWAGGHFAMIDGTVLSPVGTAGPVVLFDTQQAKCAHEGTVESWKAGLTPVVHGQHLVSFALMTAFAAPLLDVSGHYGNFGFELAGPKGVGKSTLQQLAASVAGPAVGSFGQNYWIAANATANALEEIMAEHAHMPMIIEETNLFAAGEVEKHRAAKFDELIFRLADGSTKARYGGPKSQRHRFIYLTSTNEALRRILAGYRPDVSAAAADRLLTLSIDPERKYGIFDTLADGFADSRSMAEQINKTITSNYGVAIRHFLQSLVDARAKDGAALRASILKSQATFRDRAGADANVGSDVRVADAFGLVYAAGKFARRCGALPDVIECGPSALAAYRLNRAVSGAVRSPLERVRALASNDAVIRLNAKDGGPIDDSVIKLAPAIIRADRRGVDEMMFTPEQFTRLFPNPRVALNDIELSPLFLRDSDNRHTVKRRLGQGREPERVYCLRLPL